MPTLEQIEADLGFAPQSAPSEATAAFPPVTLPVLANALSLTVRAVNQLAVAGVMVKLSHGQYDLIASTRNYCERMRKPSDGNSKDRLTLAQAELAETKLAEARKELVPASQVQATWDSTLRTLRASFLGMPARVQTRLSHLTAQDVSIIDREIRDTLTELGNDNGND
jgi:terminase small subunit / prophage DNA-packing protein